jgi:hypothetical protein
MTIRRLGRLLSLTKLLLLFSAFWMLISPQSLQADEADSQLWVQFVLNGRLKKNVRFFAELQPRWGNDYGQTSLFIARSAVGYQVKQNFSAWLGYGWTPGFLPEFNNEDRWFVQFLLEDKYPGLDMTNRTRLELRSISGAGATSVRLRHLLRLSKPLRARSRWAGVFSNELFWNLNTTPTGPEEGFDQNRAFFGFAYNMDRHTRLELGYLANFINPPRARPNRRQDVLMLVFNYTL